MSSFSLDTIFNPSATPSRMSSGNPGPDIHKQGTDDGWHGVISPGSKIFPPEKDRYHLYIGPSLHPHESTFFVVPC